MEVVETVRDTWAGPLAVRLLVDDRSPGGLEPDEGVEMALALVRAGVDLIAPSAGHTIPSAAPDYRRLALLALADRIRNEGGVPVLVGGGITTLDDIDTFVVAGRADLGVLDPTLVLRPVTVGELVSNR